MCRSKKKKCNVWPPPPGKTGYPQADRESLVSLNIILSKQCGGDPPRSSKSLCSTAPALGNELLKALQAAPPPTSSSPPCLNGGRKAKQNCLSGPLRGPDCCLPSYLCQNNNTGSRHRKQTPTSLFHKFAERSAVNYVRTLRIKKTNQQKKTKQRGLRQR